MESLLNTNKFSNNNKNVNIDNNRSEIYSKKSGNTLIDNNNDYFESNNIFYINNSNNSKNKKISNTKIINNYYNANQRIPRKNKIINEGNIIDFNNKMLNNNNNIDNIHPINIKNTENNRFNYNKYNNIFNNNSFYISPLNKKEKNINQNNDVYIYNSNKYQIKNRKNYNSKGIINSSSQRNIKKDNNIKGKILQDKMEENYYNNKNEPFINNCAFYISPKKTNNNYINKNDYINSTNNNNYPNINIDLYENNIPPKNNQYINFYLTNNINNNNSINNFNNNNNNNRKIIKVKKNSNNNISGNYYMLNSNNINNDMKSTPKQDNNLFINNNKNRNNNIKVNIAMTERNIKEKKNILNINNMNNSKIYKKKIDYKNSKHLIFVKDNNNYIPNKKIIEIKNNNSMNKSPYKEKNKNNNKKKYKSEYQKNNLLFNNNTNKLLLEKPKNKNSFKKKYYCYNTKIYEIKKCYFNKRYISKNLKKKRNNLDENHEVTFTENISVHIDNNITNASNNNNQIFEFPQAFTNQKFQKTDIIQSYSNSKKKSNQEQIQTNGRKNLERKNPSFLSKEDLEMTFGLEGINNNNIIEFSTINKKEDFDEYDEQNEDIKIMTDDEEDDINSEREQITKGKEIEFPEKINKGFELLEKIQEKRKKNNIEDMFGNDILVNNTELDNYYKKTNTFKPKESRTILKNLTKNKKCEILNNILTELFEKKEKESTILFPLNNQHRSKSPISNNKNIIYPKKIQKYEKIFNLEQIQTLENILNKKRNDNIFEFINNTNEIKNELSKKKNIMTYNKKLKNEIINSKISEESNSYSDESSKSISDNNLNKIKKIISYEDILNYNKINYLCSKNNFLPKEVINHCNNLLNYYEKEYKKNIINNDVNYIEKWNRKDMSKEIKQAEEYVKKMNIEMSKNNFKYEIIEILNTITVDNYEQILDKISNIILPKNNKIKINQEMLLDNQFRFSEIIIEKAILEKNFVKLYAKLCYDLYIKFIQKNKKYSGENLQSLLISECKQKFNDYLNINNKKKFLGNINFIVELIDANLFDQKIGFEFLGILFKNYFNNNCDNDIKNMNLEGGVDLLNKFGKIIYYEKKEKYLQNLNFYMNEYIIPIIKDENKCKNIKQYLKYKIINLIEKSKNNWKESLFEKSIIAKGKNSKELLSNERNIKININKYRSKSVNINNDKIKMDNNNFRNKNKSFQIKRNHI